MLAYILALVVGFGSLAIYMAAFFFPEVHRKGDFIWSGVGLFYALVLWTCAGRITGAVLLGQAASVALVCWFVWQTLTLRRFVTPETEKTVIPSDPSGRVMARLSGLVPFKKRPEKAPVPATPTTTLETDSPKPVEESVSTATVDQAEKKSAIADQVQGSRDSITQVELAIASPSSPSSETEPAINHPSSVSVSPEPEPSVKTEEPIATEPEPSVKTNDEDFDIDDEEFAAKGSSSSSVSNETVTSPPKTESAKAKTKSGGNLFSWIKGIFSKPKKDKSASVPETSANQVAAAPENLTKAPESDLEQKTTSEDDLKSTSETSTTSEPVESIHPETLDHAVGQTETSHEEVTHPAEPTPPIAQTETVPVATSEVVPEVEHPKEVVDAEPKIEPQPITEVTTESAPQPPTNSESIEELSSAKKTDAVLVDAAKHSTEAKSASNPTDDLTKSSQEID